MTPEERSVRICPAYQDHAHGNLDAMGKCCEACEPIAAAIREAVAEERKQWVDRLRDLKRSWRAAVDAHMKHNLVDPASAYLIASNDLDHAIESIVDPQPEGSGE